MQRLLILYLFDRLETTVVIKSSPQKTIDFKNYIYFTLYILISKLINRLSDVFTLKRSQADGDFFRSQWNSFIFLNQSGSPPLSGCIYFICFIVTYLSYLSENLLDIPFSVKKQVPTKLSVAQGTQKIVRKKRAVRVRLMEEVRQQEARLYMMQANALQIIIISDVHILMISYVGTLFVWIRILLNPLLCRLQSNLLYTSRLLYFKLRTHRLKLVLDSVFTRGSMLSGQQTTSAPIITSTLYLNPSPHRNRSVLHQHLQYLLFRSSSFNIYQLPSVRYTFSAQRLATIPLRPAPAPSSNNLFPLKRQLFQTMYYAKSRAAGQMT